MNWSNGSFGIWHYETMVLDFFCHMWMSQVEKNEEKYEDESFGVGALTVGMQVKKAAVSSPSFSLHQQPWLPPQKKTALRIPKKVTLKNVDDVTGQVQCMHYLVGGEGWLSTILGFLPEMDYVSPILITSQPLFKYMNLDILHLDDVWYSTLTNPHISWSKE